MESKRALDRQTAVTSHFVQIELRFEIGFVTSALSQSNHAPF